MTFAKLTRYLDSFYREKNIPGLGCAVYYRHEPVYLHGAGFADVERGRPFAPDTLVRLYSATKIATCTAALQLWERGAFGLDEALARYLPEFADMGVCADGGVRPCGTPVSIRHLFTMTAGIDGRRDTPEMERMRRETGGRCPTREAVRALAAPPLRFEPGTRFEYGVCHDVLGALVEAVSGERFGEYLRRHVFEPIGMRETGFAPVAGQAARMAVPYQRFDAAAGRAAAIGVPIEVRLGEEYESGGGGLVSSVRDYILLAETLCRGGEAPSGARVLRRETVEAMRQNQLRGQAMRDFSAFGGWSKAGYGYGLGVRTLMDRERSQSLSANGEFGWDGACGCYVLVDPDEQVALFYAQEEAGSRWYEWHGTIRNTVYACLG